jgi:hypothetical protein
LTLKKFSVEGDAVASYGKGRRRVTFDLKAKAKFTGSYNDEEVEGELSYPNIDDVDGVDGDYKMKISIKKPTIDTHYSSIKKAIKGLDKVYRPIIDKYIQDLLSGKES